jgi:DNA polymerase III delta prime subunit
MQEKKKKIINYFSLLKKYRRLGPSYLFIGEGIELVLDVVKILNCSKLDNFCDFCDDCQKIGARNHPDVFFMDSPTTIKIEVVREAQKFLSLKSFQAPLKNIIVNNAHKLTLEAASAFLKTLEEPVDNSFIVLISSRPDLMLPTIISRCRKIYMQAKVESASLAKSELIDFLKAKNIYISDRQHLSVFLLQLISLMRDYLAFYIHRDRARLIDAGNYEIILSLKYTFKDAIEKLEAILKIYTAISNININLACNLLRIKFS